MDNDNRPGNAHRPPPAPEDVPGTPADRPRDQLDTTQQPDPTEREPVAYRYTPLIPDPAQATMQPAPSTSREETAPARPNGRATGAEDSWPAPFEVERQAPPQGNGHAGADHYGRAGTTREVAAPGTGNPLARFLRWSWPLLLLLLTKAKYLAFLLKFKFFGTFVTMLLSLGVYAAAFGLPFAVGFIALLFVHEMGHALVLKQQGVRATAPLFIPFMGAFIGMKELPKNAYNEAKMALGGPVLGSLGALGCLVLWQTTGSPLFLALTYIGCWLNLFNLVPVSPLDGGRAMAAISPYGWLLGLGILLLLVLRLHSLFLGFILVIGGMEVFQRWRTRRENPEYYALTGRQRLLVAATYFGLAALLALAMGALEPQLLYHRPTG